MRKKARTKSDGDIVTVADVGSRFGLHPSWQGFRGSMRYLAFEPDSEEVKRLHDRVTHPGFELFPFALASKRGRKTLHLTEHRGCSSFFRCDPNSYWFSKYRPKDGTVSRKVSIKTDTLDHFAKEHHHTIDFLKLDVEGAELDVLRGASRELSTNILGIRCEVHFQSCYQNQPLFDQVFAKLYSHGFSLLNLDYSGQGMPCFELFQGSKSSPANLERYGMLVGTDAVFLKLSTPKRASADDLQVLKKALFCFLNHAPDLGVDLLTQLRHRKGKVLSATNSQGKLFGEVQRLAFEFLGGYRLYPSSANWKVAQKTAKMLFDLKISTGTQYYEQLRELSLMS